ncbi:MAG: cation:proton antiporter, partial [Sphingomonadaceae bacterium]|nr:cation:proton antiporter [Sphingomonadaceae bacterium]
GLGLALALSSTALVLPMAGTRSPVGRAAFGMLLFEDVALVPIVFLLGALAPQAADAGFGALLRTVVLGLLTIVALMAFGRYALPRLFARAARTKSPELFLSVSLLIVILASLITTAVGLSPIVGALIAGLLIAETEYRGEVEVITAPFKGLALGVFLITIGMSVDFAMIGANWPALLGALAGVLIIKTLVTALLLRLRGAKRAVAIETGLLMASPSETTLIVLTAAMAAQVINPADAAFWQIVTAVGLTITPLLAMLGHIAARRAELRDAGAQGALVEEASPDPRAIVIGFGRVGQLVCDMLARHGKRYVAIDSDIDTVIDGRAAGFPVIFGDVARPDMLRHLELERASAVVLTMDDPVQLVALVTRIRADHPALTLVARARDADHAAQLYRAGATDTVPETLESSLQLSEAALVALGVAMGPVIASIHEKRDELRAEIMSKGELDYEPSLKPRRLRDAQAET